MSACEYNEGQEKQIASFDNGEEFIYEIDIRQTEKW